MKQNILNPYHSAYPETVCASGDTRDGDCLVGFVMRWAFFGLLMWWISSALGSHAIAWLIGLAIGFALVRKELCA